MKKSIAIVLGSLFFANYATAQLKQINVQSKISKVILYRSQALVSREVKIGDQIGELAVVINNLPSTIEPSSLFALSDSVQVRSVQYLTEYIKDDSKTGELDLLNKKQEKIDVQLEKIIS